MYMYLNGNLTKTKAREICTFNQAKPIYVNNDMCAVLAVGSMYSNNNQTYTCIHVFNSNTYMHTLG